MKFLFSFLLAVWCAIALAGEPIRIAIIDTGYNPAWTDDKIKLCPKGHYDFAQDKPVVGYTQPHGTNVATVIARELKDVNYCAVIFQVEERGNFFINAVEAVERAVKSGAQVINISIIGPQHVFSERNVLGDAVKKGIVIFVAAGNDNKNLDVECSDYPPCYRLPGVYVVGALSPDQTQKATYSNYGEIVTLWYPGSHEFKQGWERGTSFASPAALADYVRAMPKRTNTK